MTVFLGCGFAAKYREGGGNFSVPLQWMRGLKRTSAIWLEIFPASGDEVADARAIRAFQAQLRSYGLARRYCLLYQPQRHEEHELEKFRVFGMSRRALRERLAGPTTLLNLSYSVHPPLLLEFERRIFCDLDPGEILYWMTQMDLGQSTHHEFWTIGLNVGAPDCQLPKNSLHWKTFFPLVDTGFIRPQPRARFRKFTTVGQWYWDGAVEVDGDFPDLSKKAAFEKYLDLPKCVPEARFELAMNLGDDEPERARLAKRGWKIVDPHRVARTAKRYRHYLASADAEFTTIKGVDVIRRTGWLSDRAAVFLAMGRPVVTEDSGAERYLPAESGFYFVRDLDSAMESARVILRDWKAVSRRARAVAIELFDATRTVRRILAG